MSIFNWKSKKEDSMPAMPELPDDLKVPQSNLAEPPKPSYADQLSAQSSNQMSLPPLPNMDLPSMDLQSTKPANNGNIAVPLPNSNNAPAAPTPQNYNMQDIASLEKEAKSKVNFDFDDFSLGDLGPEIPAQTEKKNLAMPVDDSKNLPKVPETKSPTVEIVPPSLGPVFVKVENFKKMIEVIAIAKDEVDSCIEKGNLLLNDNNAMMKQSMDNLQVNMQQIKAKLYRTEKILFE